VHNINLTGSNTNNIDDADRWWMNTRHPKNHCGWRTGCNFYLCLFVVRYLFMYHTTAITLSLIT